MSGPSTGWVLAAMAISETLGLKPLPTGVSTATVGNWKLTINTAKEPIDEIPPFEIRCENTEYFAFASFGPSGGMIGGYSEDRFIDDMKQAMPAEVWEPMLA